MERFLKIRCGDRLGLKGLDPSRPYFMQFTMKAGEREFFAILAEEAKKPLDPMELVDPDEVPVFEKYDEFVPPELVKKGFAYGVLGIDEMLARVLEWGSAFAGI
jgi:ATP-dependent Lhr-like helicase